MPQADLKMLLRSAQVFFPWAVDAKAYAQRVYRQTLRIPFEEDFRYLATKTFPADRVLVDIGGNRGQSIDAIRMMQPSAIIHSFEPNPICAARLREMFRDDPRVVIHPVGLGAEPGEFTLHLPIYRGFAYDGLASFDREAAAEWLPSRILGFDRKKLEVRPLRCKVETLDSFGLQPAFIKIDVQGWEKNVLLGGMETLRRTRPIALLETPDAAIVELLATEGYAPYRWLGDRLQPGEGALNTYFVAANL